MSTKGHTTIITGEDKPACARTAWNVHCVHEIKNIRRESFKLCMTCNLTYTTHPLNQLLNPIFHRSVINGVCHKGVTLLNHSTNEIYI
jgi:uncharacterized CHY-type Zn-finger protein